MMTIISARKRVVRAMERKMMKAKRRKPMNLRMISVELLYLRMPVKMMSGANMGRCFLTALPRVMSSKGSWEIVGF